eukprot:10824896-Ditylum_brightwellii.AAC.1
MELEIVSLERGGRVGYKHGGKPPQPLPMVVIWVFSKRWSTTTQKIFRTLKVKNYRQNKMTS